MRRFVRADSHPEQKTGPSLPHPPTHPPTIVQSNRLLSHPPTHPPIESSTSFKPPRSPLPTHPPTHPPSLVLNEVQLLLTKACEMLIQDLSHRGWACADEENRRCMQRCDIARVRPLPPTHPPTHPPAAPRSNRLLLNHPPTHPPITHSTSFEPPSSHPLTHPPTHPPTHLSRVSSFQTCSTSSSTLCLRP